MRIVTLIKTIFSITRFTNLFIICLSFFMVRYTIVKPILSYYAVESGISDQLYLLLIISTLLVAAGGYIINDYFDTAIDKINKPGKNLIEVHISKRSALIIYAIFTLAGLSGAFAFGHVVDKRYAIMVFLLCAGLLYFYSASYKKMFLAGNLVIALLSGITIFLTILFDAPALHSSPVLMLVLAYSVFAFMMTLIREITKDCEDESGDAAFGATTLPIVLGINSARKIVSLLSLLTFGAILYIQIIQEQWENLFSFIYVSVFIQLPVLILTVRSFKSVNSKNDHWNSTLAKVIMVTGIISMLVFYLSSN